MKDLAGPAASLGAQGDVHPPPPLSPTSVTNGDCAASPSNGDVKKQQLRCRRGNRGNHAGNHHSNNNNNDDDLHENGIIDDSMLDADVDDGELGSVPAVVPEDDHIPTRIEILLDHANICTLAGAVLATLAMASMWKGRYYLGMCLNVAANVADIIDGPIARATPNRHRAFSVVGCKLDCYSDLVSHFVVPASLLMHLTDTDVLCTALAAAYVCAGILRQSYFEVTGRCDGGACIYGVTSDYMVAIYVLAMHLLPVVGHAWMPFILAPVVVAMITCSLTFGLRSRRYDGFGLFTVTAYNVSLWASCLALVLLGGQPDVTGGYFPGISAGLFAAHLLMAYPCYFRFVELNR